MRYDSAFRVKGSQSRYPTTLASMGPVQAWLLPDVSRWTVEDLREFSPLCAILHVYPTNPYG
jgi:hypothetical protein